MSRAHVFRFQTDAFDVSRERPNPHNAIFGESLLLWLREQARGTVELSEPDAEDWGWYSTVEWQGRRYLLGASSEGDDDGALREWTLQIEKQRSLTEKLLGRETMRLDDACAAYFRSILESEPRFRDLSPDAAG